MTQVEVGNRSVSMVAVRDHFAPGQYRDMSDDEKLTSPSFEMLEAGVSIGAEEPQCGTAVSVAAEYEEIVIPEPTPAESRPKYKMEASTVTRVGHLARGQAQGKLPCASDRTGRAEQSV